MNKTKVIFRLMTVCLLMGVIIPACKKDDMGNGNHGGGSSWKDSTNNHKDSTGNGGGGIDSTGNGGGNGGDTSAYYYGGSGNAPVYKGYFPDSLYHGPDSTLEQVMNVWENKPAYKKDANGRNVFIRYVKVYEWDGVFPGKNTNLLRSYSDQYYYWSGTMWIREDL